MSYVDLISAAHRLHLSYGQTLRLVLRGDLEGVRIGRQWRVVAESVERLLARRCTPDQEKELWSQTTPKPR